MSDQEDRRKPIVGPFVNTPHPIHGKVDGLWKNPEPETPWRLNYNDKRFLRKCGIDPEK